MLENGQITIGPLVPLTIKTEQDYNYYYKFGQKIGPEEIEKHIKNLNDFVDTCEPLLRSKNKKADLEKAFSAIDKIFVDNTEFHASFKMEMETLHINEPKYLLDSLNKCMAVIIPRIFHSLRQIKLSKCLDGLEYITISLVKILRKYDEIKNNEISVIDQKFWISAMINCTRSLIDQNLIKMEGVFVSLKGLSVLLQKHSIIETSELPPTELKNFKRYFEFYKNKISSNLVKKAIKKILDNIGKPQVQVEQVQEIMRTVKVYFRNGGGILISMVVIDGIYFDERAFKEENNRIVEMKIVGLIFHEVFNLVIKILENDFSGSTPITKKPKFYEIGHLAETFLFGAPDLVYDDITFEDYFYDDKRWETEDYLFPLEIRKERSGRCINPCSSGFNEKKENYE